MTQRKCRNCKSFLPEHRYFHCTTCVAPGDDFFSVNPVEWRKRQPNAIDLTGTKECNSCDKILPKVQFGTQGNTLRGICKPCAALASKEQRLKKARREWNCEFSRERA